MVHAIVHTTADGSLLVTRSLHFYYNDAACISAARLERNNGVPNHNSQASSLAQVAQTEHLLAASVSVLTTWNRMPY